MENFKKSRIPFPKKALILSVLSEVKLDKFAELADIVCLVLGDYESIGNSIVMRKKELIKLKCSKVNIYCGTCLAAMGINDCEDFFDNYDLCTRIGNADFLTSQLRKAAFLIKRTGDLKTAYDVIYKLQNDNSTDIESRLVISALGNNLFSLLLLKDSNVNEEKRNKFIEVLLMNASLSCNTLVNISANALVREQSFRYLSQITKNHAQVLLVCNRSDEAIQLLKETVNKLENNCRDYIAEAYASLGYILYLSKRYDSAIDYLTKSVSEYAKIGDLRGLKTAREMLLASFFKKGEVESAELVMKMINNDPLGEVT
jgi:tetratricopeptide (TPR) repeat protein